MAVEEPSVYEYPDEAVPVPELTVPWVVAVKVTPTTLEDAPKEVQLVFPMLVIMYGVPDTIAVAAVVLYVIAKLLVPPLPLELLLAIYGPLQVHEELQLVPTSQAPPPKNSRFIEALIDEEFTAPPIVTTPLPPLAVEVSAVLAPSVRLLP